MTPAPGKQRCKPKLVIISVASTNADKSLLLQALLLLQQPLLLPQLLQLLLLQPPLQHHQPQQVSHLHAGRSRFSHRSQNGAGRQVASRVGSPARPAQAGMALAETVTWPTKVEPLPQLSAASLLSSRWHGATPRLSLSLPAINAWTSLLNGASLFVFAAPLLTTPATTTMVTTTPGEPTTPST